MSNDNLFPSLKGWQPTRDTLQLYAKAVGVVPRAHAEFDPKWWHISLKVIPDGLVTDDMALSDGGAFNIKMDLTRHMVILSTSQGLVREFDMTAGLSATEFGNEILSAVADLGLKGEYDRTRFENEEPRVYKPEDAKKYFTALKNADRIFKEHRASLSGEVSPVQLWPHHFDLAFEWFGTLMVVTGEGGEATQNPAQLNLGFSPGDDSYAEPYFYSNPWPFESDRLADKPLPQGARWFTVSWQGIMLPYAELVGDSQAEERLKGYAKAVYAVSSPTLMAMMI
ncbi:MAG TPA: DUF5996 family protein [Anaerolineales bacterium]|nr:DUF5996 family protein [Anaerolineales bacterium]